MKKTAASYQTIAADIAKRIISEEFPVGTKLSGRTLLASQYSVSPETIRKAVAILKEANIVTVSQGKEIIIESSSQAEYFITHNQEMTYAYSLRQELEILLEQKEENDRRFRGIVNEIMRYADRLKNITPYNPLEIRVPRHSHAVGKRLQDIQLWQHTGATVIAIRRGTEINVSPGPTAVLQPEDRLVIIGADDVLQKVAAFIDEEA